VTMRRLNALQAGQSTPILCKGIGAMATYVLTVNGMEWRCERCGARVKVVA
jgi:hypothetical protein